MALTFTPGEGTNPDGSTFADPNSGSFQVRSGGRSVEPVKVTNELTGEEEWDYEVENYEEETEGFNEDDYIDALIEATPDIYKAIEWAENTQTEEWMTRYNLMVENGDLDEINKAIEELMNLYHEENGEPDDAFEETEAEPIEQEEVDSVVETLVNNEPEGMETAYSFLQQAEQTEDPIHREVLMASAEFHNQTTDASTLIQRLVDKHGIETLAPYIRELI